MKVLVVGYGGREHALCEAITKSPLLTQLYCAPGNPGIAEFAECIPIKVHQIRQLVNFCSSHQIDLVIPGPEMPLDQGLTDALAVFGIPCCGPTKAAAQMECSKAFTKQLCDEAGIPTACWKAFSDPDEALEYIKGVVTPVVIKADGLAAGKGVTIVRSIDQGIDIINDIMVNNRFARPDIVIEECLHGPELSVFALCNGRTDAVSLGNAQDYKRYTDDPHSLNTGGMGAISPSPMITHELEDQIWKTIIRPALSQMTRRGMPFKGILFAGVMVTDEGPKLIEFNVRFGDPECQAILMRLNSDLLDALHKAAVGGVQTDLDFSSQTSVVVVMTAPGYPGTPEQGSVITLAEPENAKIYHSGTALAGNDLVADGGRVLTVAAVGVNIDEARDRVYDAIEGCVDWPEGYYRTDIGI